jgi:hypothetical protein
MAALQFWQRRPVFAHFLPSKDCFGRRQNQHSRPVRHPKLPLGAITQSTVTIGGHGPLLQKSFILGLAFELPGATTSAAVYDRRIFTNSPLFFIIPQLADDILRGFQYVLIRLLLSWPTNQNPKKRPSESLCLRARPANPLRRAPPVATRSALTCPLARLPTAQCRVRPAVAPLDRLFLRPHCRLLLPKPLRRPPVFENPPLHFRRLRPALLP